MQKNNNFCLTNNAGALALYVFLGGAFDVFLRVVWAPEEGSTATAKITNPPSLQSWQYLYQKCSHDKKKKRKKRDISLQKRSEQQ